MLVCTGHRVVQYDSRTVERYTGMDCTDSAGTSFSFHLPLHRHRHPTNSPLPVIPHYFLKRLYTIHLILVAYQTGVALNRISVYLDEDEVDEQVSSLKRTRSGAPSPSSAPSGDEDGVGKEEGLGFKGASFKWNEVEEKKDDPKAKDKGKKNKGTNGHGNGTHRSSDDTDATLPTTNPSNEEDGADRASITGSVNGNEHRFELRDLTVMFPERELTVVTGPTASGKTALLVRFPFSHYRCFF